MVTFSPTRVKKDSISADPREPNLVYQKCQAQIVGSTTLQNLRGPMTQSLLLNGLRLVGFRGDIFVLHFPQGMKAIWPAIRLAGMGGAAPCPTAGRVIVPSQGWGVSESRVCFVT